MMDKLRVEVGVGYEDGAVGGGRTEPYTQFLIFVATFSHLVVFVPVYHPFARLSGKLAAR
jgi:hypothetical protein